MSASADVPLTKLIALLSGADSSLSAASAKSATDLINEIKIHLLDFPSLPPLGSPSATSAHEHLVAITSLEYATILSILTSTTSSFTLNISQLLPLYTSAIDTNLKISLVQKPLLLGLNLMNLLTSGDLPSFHSSLESISTDTALLSNPFIAYPISLERQLMVGSYDNILSSHTALPNVHSTNDNANIYKSPSHLFTIFVGRIEGTVREAIGDAMEVAYKNINNSACSAMLQFPPSSNNQAFLDYVAEFREDWILDMDGEGVTFQGEFGSGGKVCSKDDIPTMEVLTQTLGYATELERIV